LNDLGGFRGVRPAVFAARLRPQIATFATPRADFVVAIALGDRLLPRLSSAA
jgi:hypothetical protein